MRISDWSSDVCSSDLPPDRKPERERCKELHVAAAHQAEGEEPGEDDERARRKAKLERDVRPQLQPRAKPVRNGKRRYGECQPVRDYQALSVADGRITQKRAKHTEANDLKHNAHVTGTLQQHPL